MSPLNTNLDEHNNIHRYTCWTWGFPSIKLNVYANKWHMMNKKQHAAFAETYQHLNQALWIKLAMWVGWKFLSLLLKFSFWCFCISCHFFFFFTIIIHATSRGLWKKALLICHFEFICRQFPVIFCSLQSSFLNGNHVCFCLLHRKTSYLYFSFDGIKVYFHFFTAKNNIITVFKKNMKLFASIDTC